MNILQICNKSPWPAKEGGPIAINTITEGLINAGHNVKILAINTPKYFVDKNSIDKEYLEKTNYESVYVDTNINYFKLILDFFSNDIYYIKRFISKEFNEKLIEILNKNEFNIIQIESLFLSPYIQTIRKHSKAKLVLRAHNIEHLIWERNSKSTENALKGFYFNHLSKQLKEYELKVLNKYDAIATITENDLDFLKQHTNKPITSIPFSINIDKYLSNDKSVKNSLFFIGSMDWQPNIDGLIWFLDNVWEKVNKELPDLKFHIAGRNMPDSIKNRNYKNVINLGEVDSAISFMNSHSIMIVPLFAGSGVRVKIIEAMALKKTIISTSIGAEGIDYIDKKDIFIANNEKEFINKISKLINDNELCKEIGNNSYKLVKEKHNNNKVIEKLIELYISDKL